MSSLAPSPAASTTIPATGRTAWSKWNGWYRTSLVALLAYGAYVVWIVGRIWHPTGEDPVPKPLNSIFLTALSLIAVMAFLLGWRFDCRTRDRARDESDTQWHAAILGELEGIRSGYRAAVRDEIKDQLTEPGKAAVAELARIRDRVGIRKDNDPDGPTVPIQYQLPPVQPVVGVAAPTLYGPRADAVIDRAADRLLERFEEHGNQRYYAGYAHRVEDEAGGASVTALASRKGYRSTS